MWRPPSENRSAGAVKWPAALIIRMQISSGHLTLGHLKPIQFQLHAIDTTCVGNICWNKSRDNQTANLVDDSHRWSRGVRSTNRKTWNILTCFKCIKSPRWDLWQATDGHVVSAAPMGRIDFNEMFSAEKPPSLNIVHSDKSQAVLPGTNLIIRNRWNVNFPTGNDRSNSLIATFCSVQVS